MLTAMANHETVDELTDGTSQPDHVSPSRPSVSTVGGSRRDRTAGRNDALKFAAVYRRFLLEPPAVGASPSDIGTWVRVLAFASERESDVVPVFATDREWMSTAGVTLAEVASAEKAGLLTPADGGLRVGGFDHDGLRKHEALRASGSRGGKASSLARASLEQGLSPLLPSPSLSSPSPTKYPEVFECIWAETGKIGSKHNAHKAWLKNGRPAATVVRAAWQSYMRSQRPVEGYVQDLSTWLNARGWEQEWPEAKNVKPGASQGPSSTSQEAPRCWPHRARDMPAKWMGHRWAADERGYRLPGNIPCTDCREVEAGRRERHVSEDALFAEGKP